MHWEQGGHSVLRAEARRISQDFGILRVKDPNGGPRPETSERTFFFRVGAASHAARGRHKMAPLQELMLSLVPRCTITNRIVLRKKCALNTRDLERTVRRREK